MTDNQDDEYLLTSRSVRERLRSAEDDLARAVQRAQERGDLAHLTGKPLELDDDPNWFLRRTLKEAGFSHPTIERARELDALAGAAQQILDRLTRRRNWLVNPTSQCTPAEAQNFNDVRGYDLAHYRERLSDLNQATLAHNLSVPLALQLPPVNLDEAVTRAERSLPELPVLSPPAPNKSRGLLRHRRRPMRNHEN